MDGPAMTLAKPVKGTAARAKAKRRRDLLAVDAAGSQHVKARSGGRCEVGEHFSHGDRWIGAARCQRRATQVHHMLTGRGDRLSAEGVKAIRKQHVCDRCHRDITGEVGGRRLERVGVDVPMWTDTYRRVR